MNDEELSRRLDALPQPDLSADFTAQLRRRAHSTLANAGPRGRDLRTHLFEPGFLIAFALVYAIWTAAAIAPLCKPNLARAERYAVAEPK